METLNAAELLAALGHESRLSIFRMLVEAGPEGLIVGSIGETLHMAPATLSFHLAHLSRVGLIDGKRESRFIRYSANYPTMDELIAFLTRNCCQGNACLPQASSCDTTAKRRNPSSNISNERTAMSDCPLNVLFLCTGNSARSILAEAILDFAGKGRFKAYSAGSHPGGSVNPYVVELLEKQGLPTVGLRSKSWDEFATPDAPVLDFVFTVCDTAAGEICPVWPGQPMTAHWGISDPVAGEGNDETRRQSVAKAFHLLNRRIGLFINLPIGTLDKLSLQEQLRGIGDLRLTGE